VRRGFTLPEILIAIVVVLVLGGITVSVVKSVKRATHQAQCLQNLRSLGVGVEGFSMDHGGRYPDLVMGREVMGDEGEGSVLENELLEYVGGDVMAFQCPADHEHFAGTGCSYFWNSQVSGQLKTSVVLLGLDVGLEMIPLISDKEAFHGDENGTNFLYADQSVARIVKLEVGSR